MNKDKRVTTIGPLTLVDLPELGILQVPAKVDTGADSSSIWATNIKEKNKKLSFVLFDSSSPFYTGKVIETGSYRLRSIKNSFGKSEFRYKVALKMRIEDRKINMYFTLSNRENNKYPVLIGRKSLRNKFLVDVSKPESNLDRLRGPREVLVLVNSGGPKIRSFYEQINKQNSSELRTYVVKYKQLRVSIGNRDLSIKFDDGKNLRDLKDLDLIYFKTFTKNAELAAMVAAYAGYFGVPYVDQMAARRAPNSKAYQMLLLRLNNISVPDSILVSKNAGQLKFSELVGQLGHPFVLKDNYGKKGRSIFIIRDDKDYKKALEAAHESDIELVAQKYLDHDKFYRVIVMGKRVELVMYRLISSDAKSKAVKVPQNNLPGEIIKMCIKAAEALGLQIAGVDILQDTKTKKWYCLEANNSPQLVAGAFVPQKQTALTVFLKKQAKA